MHIIVNSDVLRAGDYLNNRRVPNHHKRVYERCAELGGRVHVPKTSLLEFERYLVEEIAKERVKLDAAYELLDKYGVDAKKIDATDLVTAPSIIDMIRECGVEVIVEEPTAEELRTAHDRACLHQVPHAPDQEGEMRDTVIWLIALRVCRQNNGGLLISRDKLHRNRFGDEEAARVGLHRVKEFTLASAELGIETPALAVMRALILPVWNDLKGLGIPLSDQPSLRSSSNEKFRNAEEGLEYAKADIIASNGDGADIQAEIEFTVHGDRIVNVTVLSASSDGISIVEESVTADVNRHSDVLPTGPVSDELDSLRELMRE